MEPETRRHHSFELCCQSDGESGAFTFQVAIVPAELSMDKRRILESFGDAHQSISSFGAVRDIPAGPKLAYRIAP